VVVIDISSCGFDRFRSFFKFRDCSARLVFLSGTRFLVRRLSCSESQKRDASISALSVHDSNIIAAVHILDVGSWPCSLFFVDSIVAVSDELFLHSRHSL